VNGDDVGVGRYSVNTVKFPIQDPSPYYSRGDEGRFFGCIYALPEYVEVKWDGAALQLTLKTPLSRKSFQELIALFKRYQVPLRSLRPGLAVLSKTSRTHFRRQEAFWFEELFGAD